ncbi:MAG: hypothetical protein ACOYT4_01095 [Nanoarchaeota archaeon]
MKGPIKRLGIWAIVVTVILILPLLTKAPWTGSDFLFAGILLFGAGFVYEFTARKTENIKYRIAIGFAITIVLIFIWVIAATQ